ncbi:hypothetical protein XarbCFBP6827_05700 [Xanthomonas arboricola]|nr:hypothetical protein XarbCFBP6827_05700 [Xanthomonas arboricola]
MELHKRRADNRSCSSPCIPTISTGPCPLTVAGPYAAWMPRKSLQGRTCGVSCDGGRARTRLPSYSHMPRLRFTWIAQPQRAKDPSSRAPPSAHAPHSSCNNPTIRRTRATSVRW